MSAAKFITKIMIVAGVGLVAIGVTISEITTHRPINPSLIPLLTIGGMLLLTGMVLRPKDDALTFKEGRF